MAFDKIIDSAALDADLTSVADAIRARGGTSGALAFPDGFVSAVEAISAGGGGDTSTLFVDVNNRTITDFVATEDMIKLRDYMFYGNTTLKTVDLSKLSAPLGTEGRFEVNSLLGSYAFGNCSQLETIFLPDVLDMVGDDTFVFGLTWLGSRTFSNCTSLREFCTEVSFVGSSASTNLFERCTALERVITPNFSGILPMRMFTGCTNLKIVDCSPTSFSTYCFENCGALRTIVLRTTTVAPLSNVNAFTGTPFAVGGTGGTAYVKSALITSYQTATNWSTLYAAGTCNFVAIEGSIYE